MTALTTALRRLTDAGIRPPESSLGLLEAHTRLVQEWNRVVSLVSRPDVEVLESRHVIDSLALAPVLAERGWTEGLLLDVGSGAGYPAIPLAIVLPQLRAVLVERSERKAGFLQKALGALDLAQARVVCGEFPRAVEGLKPDAITARAVERPKVILRQMATFIERGAMFLCQAGDPRVLAPEMFHVEHSSDRFHVEHWEDDWTRDRVRRGSLYLVSSTTPSAPST